MAFDLNALKEPITRILSAPGVDLTTISARSVRKELVTDPSLGLTSEELKARRPEVDKLIAEIYATVSRAPTNGTGESKRKRDDQEGEEGSAVADAQAEESEAGGDTEEEPKPVVKKAKKAVERSDAELARKLSSEINGRSRRTSVSPRKTKRKTMKSSETVDSGDDGDDEEGKKKRSGGAKGGFAKQYTLSQPLSVVIREEKLSRPQVVKRLWEYIREHGLQNPSNKKEIMCNDALRAVFAVDKIDMFRMNKVLGQHLHEE
ncbi:SWIB/MDM2 domain-containing protein [Pisolithus croceorrhizus]|nr:SWIB/MDM2 domain-containing protein [Pisolithus croceorrhizus]